MAEFRKRNFADKTLGEKLREIRQESGYSQKKVEENINVSEKYIRYLEEGHYEKLPGEVYIKSFLKKYADFLSVNKEKVLALYENEKKIYQKLDSYDSNQYLPPKGKVKFPFLNPKNLRNLIIILFILAILLYLGWELTHIIAPPKLKINYPPEEFITTEKSLLLEGQTEPEISVLVNGEKVDVERNGSFKEEIILKEGVNVIEITAHKKQGEENKVIRRVMLKNVE
ncbi:MAG: helix-turn-helix domain-containing protein [Patescibacteria group bacterium]|nr:helix-turn-helix domain-containing protein [Patescibacteria group bacterium]